MTSFRIIAVAAVLGAASLLTACTTAPGMPMGTAAAGTLAAPESMAKMDAQMKTMREMHEKMMAAKTPQERNALMAAHMKAMQDGMAMMKGMQGMGGMHGGTAPPQQMMMMEKRMEMMQSMMEMMMDRMAPAPAQ